MHFTSRTWRSPYEAYSVILEVTSGCAWNRCKCCRLYKAEPFRIPPMEISKVGLAEIQAAQPHTRRLYLTGATPFPSASTASTCGRGQFGMP